jgi:hypothetical protein
MREVFSLLSMEKVRVRRVIKPRDEEELSQLEHSYEIDLFNRERISNFLEYEIENSLKELEKNLKKNKLMEDPY